MASQLLILLFSLGLFLTAGTQSTTVKELYVKPTEDTSCPEPCHTLDEYVQNATQYFVSNTVFKFLPGTHNLSKLLYVSGVSNLAMVGANGSVDINCIERYNQVLYFDEISNLTLGDLILSSCDLILADLLNFNLLRVSIEHPPNCSFPPPKLIAGNVLGTSSFTDLRLVCPLCSNKVAVHYSDNPSWLPPALNQLTIKDSIFFEVEFLIEFYQSNYNISLLLENLTVDTQGWSNSLDVYIGSMASNRVFLNNLQFNARGAISLNDQTNASSTSVYINNCSLMMSLHLSLTSTQAVLENSFVHHATFEAEKPPFLLSGLQRPCIIKNVTFSDFKVLDYIPVNRHGLFLIENVMNLSFIDCKFLKNNGRRSANGQGLPVVMLVDSEDVSFTDCEFSNNLGTPISALDSRYTLLSSNTFSSNTAFEGGALAFYGRSYVIFPDELDLVFVNNSADTVGGAIYVDYGSNTQCFFQGDICPDLLPNDKLKFEGNSAENGGDIVYGAAFDGCTVGEYCNGWTYASSWFHFDPRNTSDFSAITSSPLRPCLCEDRRPLCTTVFSNRTHYPGETFYLPFVVVGDRFGTVDGSVYAQILPVSGEVAELGRLERSQRVEHLKCTNLSYTIFSNSSAVTVALVASSVLIQHYPSYEDIFLVDTAISYYEEFGIIEPLLGLSPVYINVTLLPCPLGFMLFGEPPSCICDTQLQNNHISCNLTTQTVQRSGTEWVNASFHGSTSDGVIVSKYCPNNYCKPETVDVNLEHPDTQCAFNHSGILCGGCKSGRSRALGSAQCLHCSNAYLALLIPFALAGFVLVFFIKLLNLTVAQGTLNGLIFYANIVRANQVAWIPSHDQNILTVFIAWLNLDLGIETCFFDGLDAYWVTWLQFVFPLYIWAIAILIIIFSRYSSTAAKIFGNNSVPTLATLLLLSYSKLLRTIISIFRFSTFDYPDGTSETVWSYDGNNPYFSPKLIPLLFVAVAAVLFLWLPYTAILTCAQYLHKSSNERVVKVLTKLKPFLDAYFGPLKDSHRYWVGLLLLVRGVVFICFAATPTEESEVDLLITLVAVLCVMVYLVHVGGVYENSYLNLLENSLFLNLGVLAGGTLYAELAGKNQSALAYTSVGIAFTQFVVIVFIHGIICLKETWLVRYLCQLVVPSKPPAVDPPNQYDRLVNAEPAVRAAQEFVVSYNTYREPMLKYLDSPT